jgi:hypothetical protein
MVTEITGVEFNQAFVSPLIAKTPVSDTAVLAKADIQLGGLNVGGLNVNTQQVSVLFAELSGRQDEMKTAALLIRQADTTLENAGSLLGQIEEKLGEIVKMFPPYPIDNPQRIELLNDIDGLRKQVDALTYPPKKDTEVISNLIGTKLNESGNDKINGDNIVDFAVYSSNGEDVLDSIKEQLGGLALEPTSARDAEVDKAFEQVKDAKFSLRELQEKIWQDVVSYVKQSDKFESENKTSDFRQQIANFNLTDFGIGKNAQRLIQAVEMGYSK